MKSPMLEDTRAVGFGFMNDTEVACNETWFAVVQRPFRGIWLWLWGDPEATLHAVYMGAQQQLVSPARFGEWMRPIAPTDFLRLCAAGSRSPPPTRRELRGEPLHQALAADNGRPRLTLPSLNVGGRMSFRYDGKVRGIVLVGKELL